MFNFKLFSNIKVTVLIGYLILFALAIFGLNRTYKELVVLSELSNPLAERKELDLVSNALVALYEAESMRKAILSDNLYTPQIVSNYIDYDNKVRFFVDSLYQATPDENIRLRLDTVNDLLNQKKSNFESIISLMDSIRNLPYSKILSTKLLTRRDVENLGKIIDNQRIELQDTSYYIRERRSFVDRLRAVFTGKEDSTKVVSSSEKTRMDTLVYTPGKLLTDTLVKFMNDVNERSDRRKLSFVSKLTARQNEMLLQDDQLSEQIHSILKKIEDEEKRVLEEIAKDKASVLKRSSKIVSGIALASILVLLLFLPLTLFLINRNQKFRKKLEESNFFAQKLLKSRERLLLMISHDVKAPLSSIIGHIELMLREKMPKEDKEHLLTMRSSSEQILDLSNKLMDFHRLEQGKSELNTVSFFPQKLLEDVYKSFIPIAKKKNLALVLNSNIDKDQAYDSDPFIIKQILNNILNNAIKFTNSGSIALTTSIDSKTNNLHISIKDTGVGIRKEDIAVIFDDFSRVGSVDEQHSIDGFGLGLPITKRLIGQLQGEIRLESEENVGTEFFITIPLVVSTEKIVTTDKPLEVDADVKISATVLLVDDDEAILNVYAKLLEKKGLEVVTCYDSTEVVDLLNEINVDVIFTDIQMPKMNGFELVKKIRALGGHYADIPIVAVSARSDVSEKDFKAAGFTSFISKPIPFGLFYQKIAELLEVKKEIVTISTVSSIEESGFNAIIEYIKDDKEVSLDIMNTFLEDSKDKLERMKSALESTDWETIKFISHKMLPLITLIGEKEIAKNLVQLESGKQDLDIVTALIPQLERVNSEAASFIENYLKS